MNEATIYTAPDANITITDDTVEHIIYNTHTIKIDRNRLKEITPELLRQLAKVAEKLELLPQKNLVKKHRCVDMYSLFMPVSSESVWSLTWDTYVL